MALSDVLRRIEQNNAKAIPEEFSLPMPIGNREERIEQMEIAFQMVKEGHKDAPMKLFELAFTEEPRAKGAFHPSEIAGEDKLCYRKMYYQYAKLPPDSNYVDAAQADNKLLRLFDLGSMVHLYLQYNLWRMGLLEEAEAAVVSEEFGVSGKTDGIIVYEGERMVLEIKTITTFGFAKLTKPYEKHINQASIYAHFKGLSKILFIYYDKNTSDMKYFIEEVNVKFVAKFKREAEPVIKKYNTNLRKTRSADVTKHTVGFDRICSSQATERAMGCPFASFCFKNA